MSKYVYKPYSSILPQLFEKESARIRSAVSVQCEIEHVGSTAVAGLGGKGIIDIAIAVDKKEIQIAIKELELLGYTFKNVFNADDRFYCVCILPDPEEGSRRYHIHLLTKEHPVWKELLGFRDFLRAHPKEAEAYGEIKKQAAQEAKESRDLYQQRKEPKIHSILNTLKE